MASIVHACATAHLPGLTGWFDRADADSQHAIRTAYEQVGNSLRAAQPDVVIMVANDHILNYHPANYPDFVVGTAAEHTGPAEWFQPWLKVDGYRIPGAPEVANEIVSHLATDGLYVTAIPNLDFDDNISVPVTIQDLKASKELRERFRANQSSVLDGYSLTPQERQALDERSFRALYVLGVHPYALSQLSRLIFGTVEGAGSSEASLALVRALNDNDGESGSGDIQ